jgi:sigma-E factor negative regulatory protein RseB
MKKWILSVLISLSSLGAFQVQAEVESAHELMQKMNQSTHFSSYEMNYVLIKKSSVEPIVFRHGYDGENTLSQLVYLSGPVREVIRQNDQISYVEPNLTPFTVRAQKMVAPLLPMLDIDPNQLQQHYDFINVGRSREAGREAQVIRVVPKDGQRYSYVVWVELASYLPLRTDLLDRDGDILEQYRTVSFDVSDSIFPKLQQRLSNVTLPEVVSLPDSDVNQLLWKTNWIPNGFNGKKAQSHLLVGSDRAVESQIFSDGLFEFSVYVARQDELSLQRQLVRQGRRTLQSMIIDQHEVIIVGDIPPSTAQRIINSVVFTHSNDHSE